MRLKILNSTLGILLTLILGAQRLFGAGTPAGTVISSRASASYTTASGGSIMTVFSNTVAVTVKQVAAVNSIPPAISRFSTYGVVVDYGVRIINSGNGTDKFALTSTSSLGWAVAVYRDLNGNGLLDSDDSLAGAMTNTDSLKADSSVSLIVRIAVPAEEALNSKSDNTLFKAASLFDASKSASSILSTTVRTPIISPENAQTADNLSPAPGAQVTFTLAIMNAGLDTARDVVVSDKLDPRLTYISSTNNGTHPAPDSVRWNLGLLGPGSATSVSVTVRVHPGLISGTMIPNTMSVAYSDGINTRSKNSNTVVVRIGRAYDVGISSPILLISKEPSDSVVYNLKIENKGNTKDVIEVSHVSSQPLSWVFVTDRNVNGIPDPGEPQLTNTNGFAGVDVDSVRPGDSVHVLAVTVLPRVDIDQTVDQTTFTVTSAGNTARSQSAVATTVTNIPVINLGMTFSRPGDKAPGDTITYTIAYPNVGHAAVGSFRVVDEAPDATEYVANSVVLNNIPQKDNSGPVIITTNPLTGKKTVIIDVGTVLPSSGGKVEFLTQVKAGTPGGTEIRNRGFVTYRFKSFQPETLQTPLVSLRVASQPNFEFHYSIRDSNVINKETLRVWIGYLNVGNAPAASVLIRNILPPFGMKVIGISGGGTRDADTLRWEFSNVTTNRPDSIWFDVVVDSTLVANTRLRMSATLTWPTGMRAIRQDFVVGSFAKFTLTNNPNRSTVFSGRDIEYTIVVRNRGNYFSTGTQLRDTISQHGEFIRATIPPDSIGGNGRTLLWNLGTLQPGEERSIVLTVHTHPNLGLSELRNAAFVGSSNSSATDLSIVLTSILPLRPDAVIITPAQKFILGKLVGGVPADSAFIIVQVNDSLHMSMPDGVPVRLTTTLGTFSNGRDTITRYTGGGGLGVYLRSADVQNTVRIAKVTATAGTTLSGQKTESADVVMYPGAVTGIVRDAQTQLPFAGAIVKVINTGNESLVGSDTTEADGIFFIPLNFVVTIYRVETILRDRYGDTIVVRTVIGSDSIFGKPAYKIPNTIVGRLQYRESDVPVPVGGITVYLDSVSRPPNPPSIEGPQLRRVDSTLTDQLGRFKFENLSPAVYQVTVDSIRYPLFRGSIVIHDTVPGTVAMNLNILVAADSSMGFTSSGPPAAFAGDTIQFRMKILNLGNVIHTRLILEDTLSNFFSFVAMQKGVFATARYDSGSRVVRWAMDSMSVSVRDSVWLKVAVVRNVPDSSTVVSSVWMKSDQSAPLQSRVTTLVRSAPAVNIGIFIAGKDTVVAGDSVYFKVWYSNTGTDSLRNVRIVDSIFNAGKIKVVGAGRDTTTADSLIVWNIGGIAPASADTLEYTMITNPMLEGSRTFLSRVHIVQNGVSKASASKSGRLLKNLRAATLITVAKTGNKKVAEIGDVVTYQVLINGIEAVKDLQVVDQLPYAFQYYQNSARFNGKPVEPVQDRRQTILRWTLPDTIRPGKQAMLLYQLVVGADGVESEGINRIFASGKTLNNFDVVSLPGEWQVTVRPGVFTERGIILGKVFYDDDRNSYQDRGEDGVKGVELWMEDGTRIVTGDDGKYSLPEVKPGQHVIRVNERTLPEGTALLKGGRDFAGDPSSRFVRLSESGIQRVNFYVKRTLRDTIRHFAAKMIRVAAQRTAVPAELYVVQRNDRPVTSSVQFTVRLDYSGNIGAQGIEVTDSLAEGMSFIPGSADFNGRTLSPVFRDGKIVWQLGRSGSVLEGILKYSVTVASTTDSVARLFSSSIVNLTMKDTTTIVTDHLHTMTIVRNISTTSAPIVLDAALFVEGKSSLRRDGAKMLDRIGQVLIENKGAFVTIVGYPDLPKNIRRIDTTRMKSLADERAAAALDFLRRRVNVDSTRLLAAGVFAIDSASFVKVGSATRKKGSSEIPNLKVLIEQFDTFVTSESLRTSTSSKISVIRAYPRPELYVRDSLIVIPGDEVLIRYELYANPLVTITSGRIIDSLGSAFTFLGGNVMLNELPLVTTRLSNGVCISSTGESIRKGLNRGKIAIGVPVDSPRLTRVHRVYFEWRNNFGESRVEKSNDLSIIVRGKPLELFRYIPSGEIARKESPGW